METTSYSKDKECNSLESANQFIVNCMTECTKHSDIRLHMPKVMVDWIVEKLKGSSALNNFHKNTATVSLQVIQIDEVFEGNTNSSQWKLCFCASADIPGPGSQQKPHLGYEVRLNQKKLAVGHAWVSGGMLKAGRPPKEITETMDTYTSASESKVDFPNGGKIHWKSTFQRLK